MIITGAVIGEGGEERKGREGREGGKDGNNYSNIACTRLLVPQPDNITYCYIEVYIYIYNS